GARAGARGGVRPAAEPAALRRPPRALGPRRRAARGVVAARLLPRGLRAAARAPVLAAVGAGPAAARHPRRRGAAARRERGGRRRDGEPLPELHALGRHRAAGAPGGLLLHRGPGPLVERGGGVPR